MSTCTRHFRSMLIGLVTALIACALNPFHVSGVLFQAPPPVANKPPVLLSYVVKVDLLQMYCAALDSRGAAV
jgi:hypothetical protein